MARGVALDLLHMAKRVGPQYEAAEYEDLSGEKNLTLDRIVADDRRSHQALIMMAQWNSQLKHQCRCQNRRISGRGSRSVRLRLMVIGGKGQGILPGSGPLDGGKTLLPS